MSRQTIILLEDDADRVREFESAVAELGQAYRLRVWRDAHRLIAECHEVLADTALISLDHDLNKETPDSPDPGDGLEVASFLARLPRICPVILHTSNTERLWSMHNEFRFGGWETEHVMPLGTDWIRKSWLPMARKLLDKFKSAGTAYFQPIKPADQSERLARTLLSLHGLAIGDGIGEMMFSRPDKAHRMILENDLPAGPWWHTDDTEMAIAIVEVLRLLGSVNQDALARQFAWRYERDPDRGYGTGARHLLRMMTQGADWRVTSREAFGGQGSMGNGSAMRVAPLGAWFADDLDRAEAEARASAEITHMHPEGIAGAVAVAIAAAMAWRLRESRSPTARAELIAEAYKHTPESETRQRIARALQLELAESAEVAARSLGNGSSITCPDTVPFAIWSAAKHLYNYREAIAATASVGGDVDTNCAIVGGIVALACGWEGTPSDWLERMEPLPYPTPVPRA
ncbi:MAG: ADP-ribosylglycohydrolase family protein [Verrucomicrobiae bacterium]|nr:ADP-ribosylglycohydrolase family protein [Verrucomicrobiae bacterium]